MPYNVSAYTTAGSGTTWISWNVSNSTTATAGSNDLWVTWNGASTGTATSTITSSNAAWNAWTTGSTTVMYNRAPVETAEQKVARLETKRVSDARWERERPERERLAKEQAERLKAEAEEKEAARLRAETLLRENLDAKQKEQLAKQNSFELETLQADGTTRKYRIERGRSRNVRQICPTTGRVLKTLCAHPGENVPDADTMLAQKFWLENSEQEFLKVANHS